MVRLRRGQIWLADLGEPRGSAPAYTRPVLVIQDDHFNDSRLLTTIALGLTSQLQRADHPGNVLLLAAESGLDRDSVINVTQIVTLDKADLIEHMGDVPTMIMEQVAYGLTLALGLDL